MLEHIQNRDMYIIFKSPRQTGKTTLLYQIRDRLHGKDYAIVYLGLEGLEDLGKANFYQTICTQIQEKLIDLIDDNTEVLSPSQNVINQIAFTQYLKLVAANTSSAKKLVFMLDGIGSILERKYLTFLGTLRRLFNEGVGNSEESELYQKLMFIFVGNFTLTRLTEGANSPLYNICKFFTLDDFSQKQVAELGKNLADFPNDIRSIIEQSVYTWGSGHPYLTQRLYKLIDENTEIRNMREEETISDSIEQLIKRYIKERNDSNLNYIVNYLLGEIKNDHSHKQVVSKLLFNRPQKSVAHQEELLTAGIIKHDAHRNLVIRNKMYEQALKEH